MDEVAELLDYLSAHPQAAEILAAVYEVKTRNTKLKKKQIDESQFQSNYYETIHAGMPTSNMPDGFLDGMKWAEEQLKKGNLN